VEVVFRTFPILPYDEVAAAWHAAERARLERSGTAAPFVDGQIAAIAKAHELVLVTANVRDFVRFEALDVENWTSRPRRKH
jgi:tRNA(fMet)-specific endonuclease VapC